jgi:hypothetical protein
MAGAGSRAAKVLGCGEDASRRQGMGRERRSWMHGPGGRAVTTNLDAVLLENEALRHQVRLLREELAQLQRSWSAEAQAQAQAQAQAAADFAGRAHPWQGARAWRENQQEFNRPQPTPESGWRQAAPRGERVRSWRAGPEVTTRAAPGITPPTGAAVGRGAQQPSPLAGVAPRFTPGGRSGRRWQRRTGPPGPARRPAQPFP